MFNALINLYTQGDIAGLQAKLLHSSSWQQHNFTAYGSSQISRLWMQNLNEFGFSELIASEQIDDGQFSALLCLFKNNNDKVVRVAFNFEHKQEFIKRVTCTLDSSSYAEYLQLEDEELVNTLPTADPLVITQFDHQLHPQSYHANPSDLANLASNKKLIDSWWSIWQSHNFPLIKVIYSEDANINLPTHSTKNNTSELTRFILSLGQSLNRSYSQLERVTVDKDNADKIAICWQIDADINEAGTIHRIKLPIQTFITIENSLILNEEIVIDWHAAMKRFNLNESLIKLSNGC
ncbi:hypothetical protein [Thalassomonas sp. M1454]|uniref:hypothetical protein n=1 Tax=Thalassomonas sp. M1454 TaxID=2594477 RepID=UPI001181766D|nr:hypothetical protein [Thalassomonas sp. M1454]TRX56762.1 hypothetical protein FNN08_04330 [Thalassomonas sp. M1454]